MAISNFKLLYYILLFNNTSIANYADTRFVSATQEYVDIYVLSADTERELLYTGRHQASGYISNDPTLHFTCVSAYIQRRGVGKAITGRGEA